MVLSLGVFQQIGISENVASPPTQRFEIVSESLGKTQGFLNQPGIQGTRSARAERMRFGTYTVSGQITMNPSPTELGYWLHRILGTDANPVYGLADALPTFCLWLNRTANLHLFRDCVVSKATFRGSEGGPLQLMVDIEAGREELSSVGSANGLALAALAIPAQEPYAFFESVITLLGIVREVRDWECTIDNQIVASRFVNSQYRTQLPSTGRVVQWNCSPPYDTAYTDLYPTEETGAAASAVFTNASPVGTPGAGYTLTFTTPNVKFPPQPLQGDGPNERFYNLRGQCFRLAGDPELSVTNDVTP